VAHRCRFGVCLDCHCDLVAQLQTARTNHVFCCADVGSCARHRCGSGSRDAKYILYTRESELWVLTYPELKSSLFLKAPSIVACAQFSPNGKWVAYASNETGRWEIYVTSFPEARGKWQVSSGGGEVPRWRADGKEIFFLSADNTMMAAPVTSETNFDSGNPVALFQTAPRQPSSSRDQFVYDVSKDGQHFLILTQVKQPGTPPMTVVLNWTAKLNK